MAIRKYYDLDNGKAADWNTASMEAKWNPPLRPLRLRLPLH